MLLYPNDPETKPAIARKLRLDQANEKNKFDEGNVFKSRNERINFWSMRLICSHNRINKDD